MTILTLPTSPHFYFYPVAQQWQTVVAEAKMERAMQASISVLLVSLVFLLGFGGGRVSAGRNGITVYGRKSARTGEVKSYAVIFDAGSSGSRVHVYCFDQNLDLLPIGEELELFVKIKPGLSSYANNPEEGAKTLLPLLEKAESVIPQDLRGKTPVRVGATAGLRSLGSETSEKILEAVRDLLQQNSSLDYKAEWVSILDGMQEGSYLWVTINFLLKSLEKPYTHTVGVVDLGGGSVQMAYAMSESAAANAPAIKNGTYVTEFSFKGAKHYLYVHSYLNYGLLAFRAEILKNDDGSGHLCVLKGYNGTYAYGGNTYDASAPPSGASYAKCRRAALKALKVNEPCPHKKCTFGGVWNGGGGDGQKHLFLASFFFDKAAQTGFIDSNATIVKAKPSDFEEAAKRACKLNVEAAKSAYPTVWADDVPFVCMDLVYQYTLLVHGFGLRPEQKVKLVNQVPYGEYFAEAAWPLGSAVEVITSSASYHAYS